MRIMKLTWVVALLFMGMSTAFPQEFLDAVKDGNLPQIKTLLKDNPGLLSSRDDSGNSPLHMAVRQKQPEIVSFLLAEGADVNCLNRDLQSPLHIASSSGSADIARLLIEKGADITLADYTMHTPLHYAAQNGSPGVIGILLKSGAPLEARNTYGRTPLLLCAREQGTPEVARMLIEAGADMNVKDRFKSTPLELAAWRGYKGIVGVLIEKGAEIPVKGQQATTILISACQQGLYDLFSMQVEKGFDLTSDADLRGSLMSFAARGGSPEIVEALIKMGLKVDSKDSYGWTPLHYAAMNGHAKVIQTLINDGADPDARNLMGQTAFNVANEFGQARSMEFLDKIGADQNSMQFPVMEGDYLGQASPADTPVIFAPGIISSIWGLHSSLAFSPEGDEVYWVPMVEVPDQPYSRNNIYLMKKTGNRWTPPEIASFSGLDEVSDGEPFFSHDGNRLYFNSTRPNPAQDGRRKENIWFVDRTHSGWSDPKPLSQAVNRMNTHWQFSVDRNGNIYFASDNSGGFGMPDIYCSFLEDGEYGEPQNLGININSADNDMTPFISPDGDYLIYSRGTELLISFRDKDGKWGVAKKMANPVNTGLELCPLVTPDRKYLIFLSGRGGESHPWWVSAGVIDKSRPQE